MGYSVLVANSYYMALDPKQRAKMRPYPPLATLYVAAHLREAGFDVTVFDAMLADGEHEFEAIVNALRPRAVVLFEDNFNFLSKMCLTRMREAALTMACAAHAAGAVVVAAGSDVTDRPELYLQGDVDVAVFGEGDHTVLEVVRGLADGRVDAARADTLLDIEGVAVLDAGGAVARSDKRANERHPDVFAHPARDLIDIERYRQVWQQQHGMFSLNMVTTRGCPFHCNWCAKPIWGQRYAMRSAADVAAELAEVKRRYAPDLIWFADDIFGLRSSWLASFADEVVRADAVVPFTMQSRCDLMTPQTVADLARAGCAEVWLGVESGSQRVLDSMDKGIKVDHARQARRLLDGAGIRAAFFVQFGYPGERWSDILLTVELLRETLPDDIGISVSYPLPGTRFHERVMDQLYGGLTNWHDSDDLQMLFRGTYTSPFYRRLHTVVHDDLDLHRRRRGLPIAARPRLPLVDELTHEARVCQGWEDLADLERTCRAERPTLLVRAEAAPRAPDLSAAHNYE
jgi:anaerobic magnesium-protoporphyrin IX monomethyl ester cyclase